MTNSSNINLTNYCHELQNWGKEKGKWMQYYETNTVSGENQLSVPKILLHFMKPCLVIKSQRLLDVLEKLHNEKYIVQRKSQYKLPVVEVRFPAHQDAPAFVQFCQSSHMTVMFTIDPTTAENGCLEVVPGSHKNQFERGILPQEKHDGSIAVDWCNKQDGTYLFTTWISSYFWCLSCSSSGNNNTNNSRIAVYLTYNAAREGDMRDHYYAEKRKLFPHREGAVIYNLATPIKS
ncbi:hypothetical protein BDC45DRAFT_576714 [Circinella umbellata]|nr:hypothetical protein BDC45DRAFT_576714 [Circinella umbellata]